MEIILAFVVIGLLNFSKSESFSEIINSTSNEINSISGENNISTTNSNYTDMKMPTTVSTVDYFTNTSLLEDLGQENVTVNADYSNSSSRENTSASVDNDINKIIHKDENEVVSSGSEQNTQDDASYVHSSNNITTLDPKPTLEWISETNTVSTFGSKEANDLGLKQNTTDYSSATDRQETTLSEEEYYSTNADEKKASSVIDTDYDDYTYDETTKKLIRKNWQNMTVSKALNGSRLNKTKIKTSNSSRSRDKIKSHLTKDDVSDSSEEGKMAIKDSTDSLGEKASLTMLSDENHHRKPQNVSSSKKDNDSQIDQVERNLLGVTEENKNSEIDSQKSIIPKTWIPDSEIKSLLKETLDRLSVSVTTPIYSDNHTYAPKKATELETDTVTQKEITIKIEDENEVITTVKSSSNRETIFKKAQQWDSFLSKNAEEINKFDKLKYYTTNVSYSPITKLENISITTMNTNSYQMEKVLKTMSADYRKFANDSIAIKSTTKVETSSVKKVTWNNSSQTEKYPKKTISDKHLNIAKSFIRNKKCPYAKAVENFDLNKLTGYLQTVYYTMQEKITCFKVFMIKISEEERKQYRYIYGDFQGRINWTRCDFEIKTGTKLKRKHFLQNTGFPDGVYENKILVIDSDSADGLDLLPTLIDEDPDQWTPVNNLVFMRDCKSGRVLIFKRNPREKVSLKELKEALLAAGDGFNGRLSCRKKDPSRSDSF